MKSPVILFALLLAGRTHQPLHLNNTDNAYHVDYETFVFQRAKHLILVKAEVDGKSGLFILDTGASHLTLNMRRFSDKKLIKNVGSSSNSQETSAPLHAMRVERFEWGMVQRSKLLCPVADLSLIEKTLGKPILGLIGYDILQHYVVDFNFENQILTISENTVFEDAAVATWALDFRTCGHLPVVSATLSNRTIYLAFDSGASVSVLDHSWKKAAEPQTLRRRPMRYTGAANGVKDAEVLLLEHLMLDERPLQHVQMVLTAVDKFTERCFRIDGLLGINAFPARRLVLDYTRNKLHVWLYDLPSAPETSL